MSRPRIGQSAPPGAAVPTPERASPDAAARLVEVTVLEVRPDEVEVRLADGRVGVVPGSELGDVEPVVGATVEAAMLAREDPRSRSVLSVAWARKQRAWERIEGSLAGHEPLSAEVRKVVKGGLVLDLGVRAFLPASLMGEADPSDPASLVGTVVEVLVVEADRRTDRVVVSVRDLERRRRRSAEKEVLRSLEPGARTNGTVVSIAEYGAVVDLGGIRGLIHRSQLSWGRIDSVEAIVQVGDDVEVLVVDVNRTKRRIGLSLRATRPDPFESVEVGEVGTGTVVRVVEYGAFVRLDASGAEGLVHSSELSELPGARPDQLVVPGESLNVKVLSVDRAKRRLSLSVRQALLDGGPM